jgi:hypothetical protein
MKKDIVPIVIRIISYLLRYISYFFLTYIVCEFLTVLLIIIARTPLEKIFAMIISYTPTLGLWGKDTFTLGVNEIMLFFSFWSFILMIIFNLIKKVFKIKLNFYILLFIFSTFHILSILRERNLFYIILIFYFFSIMSFLIYIAINKLSEIILRVDKFFY